MRRNPLSAIRTISWPAWLASVAALALLCATCTYWAMQLLAPSTPIAPARTAETVALPDLRPASQVFGSTRAATVAVAAPSNLQVLGIVAAGRLGSAIIAVDGQRPKMFTVGADVTPTQRLAAVHDDAVVIEAAGQRTELPAPPRGSIAVLTSGPARSGPPGSAGAATTSPVPVLPGPASGPSPAPAPALVAPHAGSDLPGAPPGPASAGMPAPGAPPPGTPGIVPVNPPDAAAAAAAGNPGASAGGEPPRQARTMNR